MYDYFFLTKLFKKKIWIVTQELTDIWLSRVFQKPRTLILTRDEIHIKLFSDFKSNHFIIFWNNLGIAIYILMTNYSFFFRHPFSRLVSAYYDKVLSASGMPEALKEYIFKEFKTRKRLPRYAVKQVRHLG